MSPAKNSPQESLDKIVEHLEEEARMILPGIQALFGFQLIAVFNQRFKDLDSGVQFLHLAAIFCTVFAVLLVLMPAAYHRQAEPSQISPRFCFIGTLCLTLALIPLIFGLSFDIFVVSNLIISSPAVCWVLAGLTFVLLLSGWFVLPQILKQKR